jgi:hypothetical protein
MAAIPISIYAYLSWFIFFAMRPRFENLVFFLLVLYLIFLFYYNYGLIIKNSEKKE